MPLTVTISRAPISCQQFPCVTSSPYGASARQVLWCTDLWLYDYIHLWDPKFKPKSLSKYYIPSSGPRSLQVQSAFHQSGRVSSLWAVSLTKSSLMSLPCSLLCNLIRNKAFPHSSGLLICPLTPGCSQSTSSCTCGLRTPARNRYCPIRMSLLKLCLYHSISPTFWGQLCITLFCLPSGGSSPSWIVYFLLLFLLSALLQPRPPGILALPSKKYNPPHSLSYVSRASRGPHSHALFPGDPSSGLTHGPECDSQKDPDLCCPI